MVDSAGPASFTNIFPEALRPTLCFLPSIWKDMAVELDEAWLCRGRRRVRSVFIKSWLLLSVETVRWVAVGFGGLGLRTTVLAMREGESTSAPMMGLAAYTTLGRSMRTSSPLCDLIHSALTVSRCFFSAFSMN